MRQRTVPLQTAHFIVAYHQRDRVKLIGFNHEQAARAIFDIIAKQWCKILVNRRQVKVSF